MGMIRRIIKKMLSPYFYLTANREKGLVKEVAFWDRYLGTKGADWLEERAPYEYRIDPDSMIKDYHLEAVDSLEQEVVEILDVGSGPLTSVGKKHPTKELRIIAVDPLADEYKSLFRKHGISPAVQPMKCEGEQLTEFFQGKQFDYVHARNAIDHSRDALKCIYEMVNVTRSGGLVILNHETDEGKRESWRGLHMWCFNVTRDGDLRIYGRSQKKTILNTEILGHEMSNHVAHGHVLTTIKVRR
jgi:ubiquinone/menaquinone biosynthesis C-methylase UbiE